MCIEFAWKKGGIPILRNFMHSTEAVLGGAPAQAQKRFLIGFRVRSYEKGKVNQQESYYVNSISQAFPVEGQVSE